MIGEATQDMMAQAMGDGTQNRIMGKFFHKSVQDPDKSAEAGHPVFVDEVWVETRQPGERIPASHPMYVGDDQKWPKAWAAFNASEDQVVEGFPLEEWPMMVRSMVDNFKYHGVVSVEQLADLPDVQCQNVMGGIEFKQKAKRYLEVANAGATVIQLKEELASRDEQIALLQVSLDELAAEVKSNRKK